MRLSRPLFLVLFLASCFVPTRISSGDLRTLLFLVRNDQTVDPAGGFGLLDPGPHDLQVTLRAQSSGTEFNEMSWSDWWDDYGTVIWDPIDNYNQTTDHVYNAYGVYAEDVASPYFEGETTIPEPMAIWFIAYVSHIDIDVGTGDDETEATDGAGVPITDSGTDPLPDTYPCGTTTGVPLWCALNGNSSGSLEFAIVGSGAAVYRQDEFGDWQKVTGAISVSPGSGETFAIHTNDDFTTPVDITANFTPENGSTLAADRVKLVYAEPSCNVDAMHVSTVVNGYSETFVDTETIYVNKGAPGSTITLTAVPEPEGEVTFPPGEPTWTGGTPGDANLTVPIDQVSETATGTPYTVTCGELSVTVYVVVATVAITTTGDLKIVQDPNQLDIALTGFVQPPDLGVSWAFSANSPQIISKVDTFDPATGQTTTTITLDKQQAGWDRWNDLSSPIHVILIADNAQLASALDDTTTVTAYKFVRNGQHSPGSQNVAISLPLRGNGIGHTFRTPDPNDPTDKGLDIAAATSKFINQTIDEFSGVDTKSQNWKFYYLSTSDVGDGTYSISENVSYVTNLSGSANYDGLWHNATIDAASAGSGGVDNNAVQNAFQKYGIGYEGHPITVRIGISDDGESVSIGVLITLTFSEQDEMSYDQTVNASYQLQLSAPHVSKTQIDRTSVVKCAAGVNVTQQDDDEWYLGAFSTVRASVPESPEIVFAPGF